MRRLAILVSVLAAGCSMRGGLEESVPQAFDPLCSAPPQAVVAESDGGSALARLATDTLAAGLTKLGFDVLAPRHASPTRSRRAVNDWVFSPEVVRQADGRLQVNVELRSLLEGRRIWAITDALADLRPATDRTAVEQGVLTALAMFENDLLRCRSGERHNRGRPALRRCRSRPTAASAVLARPTSRGARTPGL